MTPSRSARSTASDDGALTAAAEDLPAIRTVTLSFLADGGDGYPFPQTDRVDLDDTQDIADGEAQFTFVGSEQDALAEYLAVNFGVDDDPTTDFAMADTPPSEDTRIINLLVPEDAGTELGL